MPTSPSRCRAPGTCRAICCCRPRSCMKAPTRCSCACPGSRSISADWEARQSGLPRSCKHDLTTLAGSGLICSCSVLRSPPRWDVSSCRCGLCGVGKPSIAGFPLCRLRGGFSAATRPRPAPGRSRARTDGKSPTSSHSRCTAPLTPSSPCVFVRDAGRASSVFFGSSSSFPARYNYACHTSGFMMYERCCISGRPSISLRPAWSSFSSPGDKGAPSTVSSPVALRFSWSPAFTIC